MGYLAFRRILLYIISLLWIWITSMRLSTCRWFHYLSSLALNSAHSYSISKERSAKTTIPFLACTILGIFCSVFLLSLCRVLLVSGCNHPTTISPVSFSYTQPHHLQEKKLLKKQSSMFNCCMLGVFLMATKGDLSKLHPSLLLPF